MMQSLLLMIPIAVGVFVVLQAEFVGQMDRGMGTMESMFVTYGGGGLLIALWALARSGGNLGAGGSLPWYVFTAGVFGLAIVGGIGFSVSRSGLVATFTLIVATQFIFSSLVDHYGVFGSAVRELDLSKAAGISMLLMGVWLILR